MIERQEPRIRWFSVAVPPPSRSDGLYAAQGQETYLPREPKLPPSREPNRKVSFGTGSPSPSSNHGL